MKTILLKISFIFLLLGTIGDGCKKDDYDPNQIFGKWEWAESWYSGFTIYKIYPEANQKKILELTNDSTLIFKENEKITFSKKIELIKDTLIYFDINEVKQTNIIEVKNDTLKLRNVGNFLQFSYPILSIYKRIN
jgi:hypothetical protein